MIRRSRAAVSVAGCLLWLWACEPQGAPSPYELCAGTVRALDPETGELFVRAEPAPRLWRADRNVPCVATKDTEIYVNDRFSGIEEIRVGDVLESVGYWDRERFVLSLVNIRRSEPELRMLDILPAPVSPRDSTP